MKRICPQLRTVDLVVRYAKTRARTYRCGSLATAVLAEEIGGHRVTCYSVDTDSYGRTVATSQVSGPDLGHATVPRGMAIAYLWCAAKYQEAGVKPRRARRGVWQGNVIVHQDCRRDRQ
jgi:endonuclease YncB( thermonuclease family)